MSAVCQILCCDVISVLGLAALEALLTSQHNIWHTALVIGHNAFVWHGNCCHSYDNVAVTHSRCHSYDNVGTDGKRAL